MKLVLGLLLAGLAGGEQDPPARKLLREASAYLWSRQGADGGWHSETYGLLRSGQALTPFVLRALLEAPEGLVRPPAGAVDRALAFIRANASEEGALGLRDPDLIEYPSYATAFALRALRLAGKPEDRELMARMKAFLISRQFREENGFARGSPAFGGWGFGGKRPPGSPGHMDLSHTRHVLEALRDAGGAEDEMYARARTFLGALINADGGFYFSPVVLDANKSGKLPAAVPGAEPRFRSYATATCDGLLALLAAGAPAGEDSVTRARRWLEDHPRLDLPEGIPRDAPVPWAEAIRYYHLAVRAEAHRALGMPGEWRARIADLLLAEARKDGSFRNPNHLMKEDDPLIATTLAVTALVHSLD